MLTPDEPPLLLPKKSWTWNEGRAGVHTNEERFLVWWQTEDRPSYMEEGGYQQKFREFIRRGIFIPGVPAEVAAEVRQFVCEHFTGPRLEASAVANTWMENFDILFVPPATPGQPLAAPVRVTSATNLTLMNTPYAADQYFSYEAGLYEGDGLVVKVIQKEDAETVKITEQHYWSTDGGATWSEAGSDFDFGPFRCIDSIW